MLQRAITVHGIAIGIPDDLFAQAEIIAARFSSVDSSTEIETMARFVEFAAGENADVAVAAFQHLHQAYCSVDNIHVIVHQQSLSTEQARTILKGYYSVWNILESRQLLPHVPVPAIFADGDVRLAAMFGGQGGMDNYLDEAAWLLDVYHPLISDFVQHMSDFLKRESADPLLAKVHAQSLDIAGWLASSESAPDADYLLTTPVAMPALGLVQAMHVAVLYKTLNMSPGDLLSHFKVAIGHSQGVTMAAAFASVTDEASFYAATERALGILLATSAIVQLEFLKETTCDTTLEYAHSSADPSAPMILVRGHSREVLEALVAEFNADRTDHGSRVSLALINGHSTFVVAGNPKPIAYFGQFLSRRTVLPTVDQSRIQFSQRKSVAEVSPLSISAPYHCNLQLASASKVHEFVISKGWILHADTLHILVNSGEGGCDLRDKPDLTKFLVYCMCVDVVDWPAAVHSANATHIVDFSPGGFSIFGKFARDAVEGTGASVISTSSLTVSVNSHMGFRADLFKQDMVDVFSAPNWQEAYGPQLIRTTHDGQLHIRTPVSLALRLPPVMVAGMTPTTSNVHFVAAISNAGYHVELAGGGLHTVTNFCDVVDNLVQLLEPGRGFSINTAYLNQKQWAFQYPAILRMRREGVPITGLCISGSVPSVDAAKEIISELRGACIYHVAFKPGSLATIRQALAIAEANPDFSVIIQWTGGRGGSYHSCEDFHEPLLETYGEIKSLPNTMLIVGSGFGDADGITPYITGQWSVRFGRAPMPVDGVLLASCVMTAKESGASLEAKELIAATAGAEGDEWEEPYTGNASGVLPVMTGFGEIAHCVATRAALALREFNDMIFAKPQAEQQSIITANKDYIIQRLNDDYLRPWFGKKSDGRVVDVEDMTYLETLNRLVEFMYISSKSKWLDVSHAKLFGEFVSRIEDRVSGAEKEQVFQVTTQLQNPHELISSILEIYPSVGDANIALEDIQYLVWLCRRSETKPVPFILTLDDDLFVWLTNDMFSQFEDLDTIVDRDVQRTFIALDPVSAKYVTTVNEPAKDILDRIYKGIVQNLLSGDYGTGGKPVVSLDYLAPEPSPISLPASILVAVDDSKCTYQLSADEALLPEHSTWLRILAGAKLSWLHALLMSPSVLHGSLLAVNPVQRVLRPMAGQTAEVITKDSAPIKLDIYGPSGSLDISIGLGAEGSIQMTMFHRAGDKQFEVHFSYRYMPSKPAVPIAECTADRDASYRKILMDMYDIRDDLASKCDDISGLPCSDTSLQSFTITEEFVEGFCQSVNNMSKYYRHSVDDKHLAPMDIMFNSASKQLVALLTSPLLHKGLMKILHLYHNTTYVAGATPLVVGETIEYKVVLSGLENIDVGQKMTFTSTFYREGVLLATSEDAIATCNQYATYDKMFRSIDEPVMRMQIISAEHLAFLEASQWFVYRDIAGQSKLVPGDTLEFRLQSHYQFKSKDMYSKIVTSGPVYCLQTYDELQHIADVFYESADTYGNSAILYLTENCTPAADTVRFEHGTRHILPQRNSQNTSIMAPSDNWEFANISGDHFLIHMNPYMAAYLDEPQVICQGMWTSAATRAVVERIVAGGDPWRTRSYNVTFAGKVVPKDKLHVVLSHTGMRQGHMLLEGKTVNQDGRIILQFTAEIAQAKTAYVFTGQGSQYVGMGMDLYMSSTSARDVWDRADKHTLKKYGVSLLKIVRENPKQYLVKFTGNKGYLVRKNYLALVRSHNGKVTQLIPGITKASASYTHRCTTGLLNATLFTQPIQTVMSLAQAADMRANGLVQENSVFAGHSLGEFGSLAAIAKIVTVEDAVDIALYRGLLLHASVERDGQGSSQYAMVSVNPVVVGNGFSVTTLQEIVSLIREHHQELLEVINYNVKGIQYVVTGHLDSLVAMRRVIDTIVADQIPCGDPSSQCLVTAAVQNVLNDVVDRARLIDGHGTTVIPGVDVPSHSSQMAGSIDTFRNLLDQTIPHLQRLPISLCERYIPNLSGRPFELTKDYFGHVYDTTHSPVLDDILQRWDTAGGDSPSNSISLARTLLVELLSYQFASSVNWIETQESIFKKCSVKRLIEVGPSATLCRMATQTLESDTWLSKEVAIWHASKDIAEVYYESTINGAAMSEEPVERSVTHSDSDVRAPKQPDELQLPEAKNQTVSLSISPTSFAPVEDVPISIIDVLRVLASQKLAKPVSAMSPSKSIKELVAGKSMIQNELISGLQKEFREKLPEHAEDQPLSELAKNTGTFTNSLGKHSQALISKLFGGKLPSGFTQSVVRAHLKEVYGLGPRRQDALLVWSLTLEPVSRLASEEAAWNWLESAVQVYAKHVGLSLRPAAEHGSSSNPGVSSIVINSAEYEKAQKKQHKLIIDQIDLLAQHESLDIRKGARSAEDLQLQIDALESEISGIRQEVGSEFVDRTMMLFDPRKARRYDSYWNWARQDVFEWIQDILSGHEPVMDQAIYAQRVHMLQNRSNPGLLRMLQAFIKSLHGDTSPSAQKALKQAEAIYAACEGLENAVPLYKELSTPLRPNTVITSKGDIVNTDVPRAGESSIYDYVQNMKQMNAAGLPLLHLREQLPGSIWQYSKTFSDEYFKSLEDVTINGMSFAGKYALVTGCGKGSIGSGLVEGLLSGGAKVIATTSNYSLTSIRFFEDLYRKFGSRGSELVLVPFNQASANDVEALIHYIYSKDGLEWDLDYIAPFAAFPEHGKDAVSVDSCSELTIRILLTNLFRMIGQVKAAKIRTGRVISPSLLILPHSANQGIMGSDGMYGETKAALHTLYNRWHSESWSEYISITGGEIGWTRSTNMTFGSVTMYSTMEEMGIRTFSREEMSFNILCLLTSQMECLAHSCPVFGDFNGGVISVKDFGHELVRQRSELATTANLRKSLHSELCAALLFEQKNKSIHNEKFNRTIPRAHHKLNPPTIKTYDQLEHLRHLEDMVDLDKVVVVTGFGEVNAFGNAALRWEQEAHGAFSVEGCIELAWMMGLIKRFSGEHPATGNHYIGWVDAKTQEPVHDMDIKAKYEPYILEHTGIRVAEPEAWGRDQINLKPFIRELQIDHDMDPFETSAEEAGHFKKGNGDKVDIWENPDGTYSVKFLKGAVIHIPKAYDVGPTFISQLPTGWDPVRFGLPADVVHQIDPVNHYTPIAAMEALLMSGITDPYELYQYFHVSKVGHAIGSCMGGAQSYVDLMRNRYLDKSVGTEMLIESSINNMSAWLNTVLFSASGPLRPTVGACATSSIALNLAAESIAHGDANVMITGAGDGFIDELTYALTVVNATPSAENELAKGRTGKDVLRPCTSTRCGFTESYGSGISVLMSASAALKFGAPIYGIIAMSATATDKSTRNASAPGQGILTIGNGYPTSSDIQLLDIKYRKQMRDKQLAALDSLGEQDVADNLKKIAKSTWGNDFHKMGLSISPLRAALATWGLEADDIDLSSFHGTSTKLNDKNESNIVDTLMRHIGRTPGLPVPVVCQKWMLGHMKAASAICSLHGILQSMSTGIIPGNRNADNIDEDFEQYEHLVYPNKTIRVPAVKAALLTSFGLSQSNGAALIVHPDYLLATLSKEKLDEYRDKVHERMKKSTRHLQGALLGSNAFIRPKDEAPYSPEQETSIYLDSKARAKFNPTSMKYTF